MTAWPLSWRMGFRRIGLLPPLLGAGLACFVALLNMTNVGGVIPPARLIEWVIPLAFGLGAAFIFAPDDEPALELLLTAPRPAPWIIYERMAALTALVGTFAVSWTLTLPDPLAVIGRWLPPTLAFGGLALYLALTARRSTFSALAIILIYAALALAGDLLIAAYPFTRALHPFLQPGAAPDLYLLNRVTLMLIGTAATAFTVYRLRDEERTFGTGERSSHHE